MKWTEKEKGLEFYTELLERGMIKDEDKEPSIEPFEYYVESFFELSTCRLQSGPIPFTAIYQYASIYNECDFDCFLYIIRTMDDVFLRKSQEGSRNGD